MNEFQERYKSFDNRKLLKIIEEAKNYQPIAVEAAKAEIANRKISEEEVNLVKNELLEEKSRIKEKQRKVKEVENKAKAIGTELIETINPIQKEPQTIDRKINLIVIVFGLLATYQIFKEFGMIKFMFTGSLAKWDLSMVLYFIPIIALPIATFLFWKRNRIGWMLMCAFFVYHVINALAMLSLTWKLNTGVNRSRYSSGDIQIEFQEIENLFPQPNPITYLAILAIFGGALWVINITDIRNIFQIDSKAALMIIGLSGLITSIMIFGLT